MKVAFIFSFRKSKRGSLFFELKNFGVSKCLLCLMGATPLYGVSTDGPVYACVSTCTCGYGTLSGVRDYLKSLSCCNSADNCNSAGASGSYTLTCSEASPRTLVGSSIFSMLILAVTTATLFH